MSEEVSVNEIESTDENAVDSSDNILSGRTSEPQSLTLWMQLMLNTEMIRVFLNSQT